MGKTIIESGKKFLSPVSVRVEVPDFQFINRQHLRDFRRHMRVAHERGVREGQNILVDVLEDKGIRDTGALIRSAASRLFYSTTDVFSGTVHFNQPGKEYAAFVDEGRGPGNPPPVAKIRAWARRKGIGTFHSMRIRAKIAREGTEAQPFFDKAEAEITRNYNRIVSNASREWRLKK